MDKGNLLRRHGESAIYCLICERCNVFQISGSQMTGSELLTFFSNAEAAQYRKEQFIVAEGVMPKKFTQAIAGFLTE